MAGEFQRSLDFFLATTADANVTRIVLAGGSAQGRLAAPRDRAPVAAAARGRRCVAARSRSIRSLDRDYLGAHSPEALIGVGLAMRAAGDK